jgi:cystathionine gamma-synthase
MNDSQKSLDPRTRVAQLQGYTDPTTGSIVPAIDLSTTYERDQNYQLPGGRLYSRADNPGYEYVEKLVTELEHGAASAVFASGMAAATSVFVALKPGDHVIVSEVIYWALRSWMVEWAANWGVSLELVDTTSPAAVRTALQPGRTRLLWIETPANPTLAITDITAMAELAHGVNAVLAVDSTFATPVFQQPLRLGADLVMHSATKYLNGHSDVIAGTLTTRVRDAFWDRILRHRFQSGNVLGPLESWLLLRGLRTLFVRVEAQTRSAQAIAEHFAAYPGVERVLYPGLPGHPGHDVARRNMQGGFGAMLSVQVVGAAPAALKVANALLLWRRATSLGGVESLVEHRASVEPATSPTPKNLLRLSVGLEAVADLIADLERALKKS